MFKTVVGCNEFTSKRVTILTNYLSRKQRKIVLFIPQSGGDDNGSTDNDVQNPRAPHASQNKDGKHTLVGVLFVWHVRKSSGNTKETGVRFLYD